MIVKTGHSRSSKKNLEEKAKYLPGWTWIIMEEKPVIEEVPLVCICYKYDEKIVLIFLMTRGVGKITDDKLYEARFF